jgi:ring-1,2-phenylacetyl-CoA epoxidase subunit PaaC
MSDKVIDTTSPGRALPVPSADELLPRYVLGVADDALVYAQRLGEWISRAPQIVEDMALGNIALDLLGQARALLTRAGELDGTGRSEDDLAYLRDERDSRNVHLVAQERSDFGFEMARMLWFSSYQCELYAALTSSTDETVAGVAQKAVKEVDYHRDHATQWMLRLGDGTVESHERMQDALGRVAPYVSELFADDPASQAAAATGLGVLPSSLEAAATAYVERVVAEATLELPEAGRWHARGGRDGVHSRAMGYLLAQLQHIARSHPGAQW